MKTLKKILILFIIFISQNNEIKAQNDKKYSAFHKLITVNREIFLSEDFYNKTIVFSIGMGVNKSGIIDTVIFSGKDDPDINRLFDLKKIANGLKANKLDFRSNKNEYLVLFVVYTRGDREFIRINNGDQYLENWTSIIKNSRDMEKIGKRQILLTPIYLDSRGKLIKN